MKNTRALGVLALLALVGVARADEGKAVDALQKVGARIRRDDKRPGQPRRSGRWC
jgi:hypothetical protein